MNKFLNEIYEQPNALKDTLAYYTDEKGKATLEKLARMWKKGDFTQVLFTGMGSSYFAPQMASCMLSNYGIPSYVMNAGELLHYHLSLIRKDTLLVCISQSGESYEIVKIMEKLPAGTTCIGITNEAGSTLARESSLVLLCIAGKEEMTSTKTYVSTLMVLSIFANTLANKLDAKTISEINLAIGAVESLINNIQEWLDPVMEFVGHPHFVQIIGRGPSYASVLQSALMFKEGDRNPAAGIYGGEFRHGPMEMVKKGFRAVLFAPHGSTYGQVIKLAEDIIKFGGRVVMVTNSLENFNNRDIYPIRIPCADEYLFPIPAIVPLQVLVNQWALDEGNEPGNFTRGAKVTIIE